MAAGAASTIQSQLAVSRPITGPRSRYTPAAIPTARMVQKNCRADRPKKMLSLYCRISFGIFTSINVTFLYHNKSAPHGKAHNSERIID